MISVKGTFLEEPFLWLCVAIMMPVMAVFLWQILRQLFGLGPKNTEAERLKNGSPFIGYAGFNTGLGTQTRGGSIIIATKAMTELWIIIFLFLAGPGIPLMIWARPNKLNQALPLPVYILFGGLVTLATSLFFLRLVAFIWHKPYAEITADSVNLYSGRKQEAAINLTDIRDVEISTSSVSSGSVNLPSIPNYSLEILTRNETVYVLCISDKKDRIEALKTAIDQRRKVST